MRFLVTCCLGAVFFGGAFADEVLENKTNGNSSLANYDYSTVKFTHRGGYIAKFYADWTEGGQRMSWHRNGDSLTSGFSEEFEVRNGVTNLHVRAIEKTGLLWEMWRTVFDLPHVPLAQYREFKIYGTTLGPHYTATPPL